MQKWDVLRIYCDFIPNPHDKFCICICPATNRFYFVNSEPPQFRKARELAVSITNFEAHFLSHTSFVDTTNLLTIRSTLVSGALLDEERHHGSIAPSLRQRIRDAAQSHNVLTSDDLALVVD